MVKLVLAVLLASFSIGLSQRELPKDYQFKCQPREGSGMLGVYEDWSKLNKDDYANMLKFDSLRKVAELLNASLGEIQKVRERDAYKSLASYTCAKAYLDVDFYVDNLIAFYQFLLKGFQASPPAPIPDDENEENFHNLMELLFNEEKMDQLTDIRYEHEMTDRSVNESTKATDSEQFDQLAESVLNLEEVYMLRHSIENLLGPDSHFNTFTEYYAATFWKLAGNATVNPGGGSGSNSTEGGSGNPEGGSGNNSTEGGSGNPEGGSGNPESGSGNPESGSGNNSTEGGSGNPSGGSGNSSTENGGSGSNSSGNSNGGSVCVLSVPVIFYGLCAFNIAAILQLLPFKIF